MLIVNIHVDDINIVSVWVVQDHKLTALDCAHLVSVGVGVFSFFYLNYRKQR